MNRSVHFLTFTQHKFIIFKSEVLCFAAFGSVNIFDVLATKNANDWERENKPREDNGLGRDYI